MLSSADESIHGLAVGIPTNHREIPGSTPGRYNLQIEITSFLGHEMRGPAGTERGGVSMAGGQEGQSARKGNGV